MSFTEGLNRVWVIHPSEPEVKIPASLEYKTGSSGNITFDVFPDPFPKWLQDQRVDCLHVIAPELGTLRNLLQNNSSFGTRGTVICYSVGMAITGDHISSDEVSLVQLTLRVEGCSAWFGTHGFTDYSGFDKEEPIQFKYEHVKDLVWPIEPGITVLYGRDVNINRTRSPEESHTLKESSRLTIEASQSMPFEDLLKNLFKVIGFLEFVTNESIRINGVFGKRHSDEDSLEFNAGWKQTRSKTTAGYHWLTFFEVFRENFDEHLKVWFDLYEKLPLALDLYRSCKNSSGLQVEFRYFSIVSALESLHRSLFEEEETKRCAKCKGPFGKSLEQRLLEIVKQNPDWMEMLLPKSECKRVADTRNYLAHQTKELEMRSFPSDQWFYWYRRLSMVFEFSVLSQLPFAHPEALNNIIKGRLNAIKSGSLGEWNF